MDSVKKIKRDIHLMAILTLKYTELLKCAIECCKNKIIIMLKKNKKNAKKCKNTLIT